MKSSGHINNVTCRFYDQNIVSCSCFQSFHLTQIDEAAVKSVLALHSSGRGCVHSASFLSVSGPVLEP